MSENWSLFAHLEQIISQDLGLEGENLLFHTYDSVWCYITLGRVNLPVVIVCVRRRRNPEQRA